ncbi:chromosome partition protein MukE [Desulfonatronum zhilinae]|nr:chromosome partition protein MukE [Desulfonatronum zhilinae]
MLMDNLPSVLWENEDLSRRIIHRLQRGEHIDAFLPAEFRFLEEEGPAWEEFFRFLGYRLVRTTIGEETFAYLVSQTGHMQPGRLGRGATFLGLFLSWHFLNQGIDGIEKVGAAEIHDHLLSTFDFNLLLTVFNPRGKRSRKKEESERQHRFLRDWMRTSLNELARYRFIEIKPSPRADWGTVQLYRLPALQRFLEVGRDLIQQGRDSSGKADCEAEPEDGFARRIRRIWGSLEVPEDEDGQELNQEGDEDADDA